MQPRTVSIAIKLFLMTAGFNIIFDRMKESFVFCIPLQILLGHLNQVGWSEQNL